MFELQKKIHWTCPIQLKFNSGACKDKSDYKFFPKKIGKCKDGSQMVNFTIIWNKVFHLLSMTLSSEVHNTRFLGKVRFFIYYFILCH